MSVYRITTKFLDLSVLADYHDIDRQSLEPRLVFYVGDKVEYAIPLDQVDLWWKETVEDDLE